MKNKYIPLSKGIHQILLIAGLLLAITVSGFAQLKISGCPLNSMDYNFNNNTWQHVANTTYSYDTKGQLIEFISENLTSGQKIRYSYSYDSTGFVYYHVRDIWRNNTWEPASGHRFLYNYNTAGQITEEIFQERSVGIWYNKHRSFFTYNSQNLPDGSVSQGWNSNINVWEDRSRTNNYTYNLAGEITSYNEEFFSNGSWGAPSHYSNLVWEIKNVALLSYTKEIWINGAWAPFRRYTKVYGKHNSWSEVMEVYQNNSWVSEMIEYYDRDSLDNDVGYRRMIWQNNSWFQGIGYRYLLTYNNNNGVMEWIHQNWASNLGIYYNSTRKVFSNFTIAGQAEEKTQLAAEVYPTPVQDILTIKLPETKGQPITATLMDVTGKQVISQVLNSQEPANQINVGTLPTGVYILKLQSGSSFRTIKVVKQ